MKGKETRDTDCGCRCPKMGEGAQEGEGLRAFA